MGIRIIIGSNNDKIAKQLGKFLTENGMHVVGETVDAYDLLRKVHSVYPDLVIIDDHMKGMQGHEISETILAERICPVIALVRASETAHFVNLSQEAMFASVVKPTGKEILLGTISLIVKSSKSILALQKEVGMMVKEKDQKAIVDEAKKVLMKNMNLTEEEAHRKIQKQSMDKGLSKTKISEMIIRTFK